MLIFKSIVGLGLFSYPEPFAQVGYIYGTLLTILGVYLTMYGMTSLTDASLEVEDSKHGLSTVAQY